MPTPSVLKRRLMAADTAALVLALALAFLVQRWTRPVPSDLALRHLILAAASLPGFAVGAAFNDLYLARANERRSDELSNILRTVAVGVGTMIAFAFLTQSKETSRLWVTLFGAGAFSLILAERQVARRLFSRMRVHGNLERRIVIIGTDAHAIGLLHTYERNPQYGYRVVGFVGDDDLGHRGGVRVLGPIGSLSEVLLETNASGVVVSLSSVPQDTVNALTRRLTDDGYHVALSSSLTDIDLSRIRPQQIDGQMMVYIEPIERDGWRAHAKRVFDVFGSASILLLSSPLWLAAVIAIKLDDRGPILFRQERVGRFGETFRMTKFRTMVVDAEQRRAELEALNESDGPLFKIRNDPRITRVGGLMRRRSIDELPQLLSVLRGDMSLVGPRPALAPEVEEWDEDLRGRLRVLPGLTGMWQVSGRSSSSFDDYRRYDLYYVDNWSLAHDLRICLRTIGVVLTGRGAS